MKKNKTILLFSLMFLLSLSFASANLLYEETISLSVGGTAISGFAEHDGFLYVSVFGTPTRFMFKLNETYEVVDFSSVTYSGSMASDGTHIAVCDVANKRLRYYNSDFTLNSSSIVNNDIGSCSGLTYKDGLFYMASTISPNIYGITKNGDTTQTIVSTFDALTHVASVGNNFYIGENSVFQQINPDGEVVLTDFSASLPTGLVDYRELSKFGADYVVLNINDAKKLYVLSGGEEIVSDFIFLNGYYWNKFKQCLNTASFDSFVEISEIIFENPTLQNFSNLGYSLQTLGVYGANPSALRDCPSGTCVTSVTTIEGKNYVEGECVAGEGVAECYTYGAYMCYSPTSYRICGDFNNDGFPEYSALTTCPSGQICTSGVIGCRIYDYSEYDNVQIPPVWFIKPDMTSTASTTYKEQSAISTLSSLVANTYGTIMVGLVIPGDTKLKQYFKSKAQQSLEVFTEQVFSLVKFNIILQDLDETTYALVDCNYKEELLSASVTPVNISVPQVFTNTISNENTKIILDFLPQDTDGDNVSQTTLFIGNFAPTINIYFDFFTSETSAGKQVTIYVEGELLINDTTPLGQELESITMDCDVLGETQYYSCSFLFNRDTFNSYYMTPRPFFTTTNPAIEGFLIVPITNDTFLLNNYYFANMPNKESLTPTNESKTHACRYNNDGSQVVRVYHSYNDIPFYMDYKDFVVVNKNRLSEAGLGAVTEESEFDKLDKRLNNRQKLGILLLAFIGMYFLVLTLSSNYTNNKFYPVLIASMSGVGILIFGASIGWIPAWLIIVMLIVASGIGAVLIRQGVIGA